MGVARVQGEHHCHGVEPNIEVFSFQFSVISYQ